jgi:hypothetical protein
MNRFAIGLLSAGVALAAASGTTLATGNRLMSWKPRPQVSRHDDRGRAFQRVGTFANYRNNTDATQNTVSEIVAATADGRTLIYTDSPMAAIGFVDISDPSNPLGTGKLAFPAGHEPTSVDVLGNQYALVAVNSRTSFTQTSGYVAVVDVATRTIIRQVDLGGQPDSIKISGDGKYAAVVIENERDETLCAGGSLGGTNASASACAAGGGLRGGLPQTPYGNPAGYLVVIELTGATPFSWVRYDVSLTGLASYAPEDPEPEFVDINGRNHAVVTLQENNHIAIVDLRTRTVINHFPAGAVDLEDIDATEDGVIELKDSLAGVKREPDGVVWVPGGFGRSLVGTANEGDLFGGSRGFSLFSQDGSVVFDAGTSFEALAVRHGHYPEDRSENKGSEPESIEYARYGSQDFLFVGSERGSFVAVYELDQRGRPQFSQFLPAPFGPEGLLAIPERNLLIASGEEDAGAGTAASALGVRSTIMIYQLRGGQPTYPQIVSGNEDEDDDARWARHGDRDGKPIGWSALSGMTAIPGQRDSLLAVWDSYYSQSRIFRIDVSEKPAVITDAITITGGNGNYDPEGITVAPDRTIWVASEGDANDTRQNLLIQTDADGNVLREVGLPAAVLACRAATTQRGTLGSGFEGVAAVGNGPGNYKLLVAQQRGWNYTTAACEDLDDDAGGLIGSEPKQSRIWIYDPVANSWDAVAWELAPKPANATWVGLSEITETPSGDFILIERDNRTGDFGEIKTLVSITRSALDDRIVTSGEKSIYDLLPKLKSTNGWITDKPEGVAVTGDGRTFIVTDNDGVEDWSGETSFFNLGSYLRLFR